MVQDLDTTLKVEESPPPAKATTPVPPARNRKRKVVELRCPEVRWFYRRKNAEKWTPLRGLDSLRLELRHRELEGLEIDTQTQTRMIDEGISETNNVVILDGLYKADDDLKTCSSLYWKEDTAELRRGTWFLPDWQPLRPEMADAIEKNHLQHFRGQTIPDGVSMFSEKEAVKKPQLTELVQDNFEVRWSSVIDVFLFNTSKASRFLRYISWGRPASLRRGYEKEGEWEDASPKVSHLILVVHGIGQKGYENLIAENTAQIRDAVYAQMDKYYPEEKTRPMFLPIEWRAALLLDEGLTDVVTLPKMASMRETLNSTAMDIMYYQSPLYRKEIIGGVVKQMNSVYQLFMKNHPSFTGPVSIFAHSLGSVISYDILTAWSPVLIYDQYVSKAIGEHLNTVDDREALGAMQDYLAARKKLHQSFQGGMKALLVPKDEQLDFKVKSMIAVGSPLAVFLVMRGADRQSIVTDKGTRIYNVFHPYDPVAYRLEPLFAPEYRHVRPVKIFTASDFRGRDPYDELPMELHKAYLKKMKHANKAKKDGDKDKNGDLKSDEMDEEDSDVDEEVQSACSSPRSISPPNVPNEAAAGSLEKPIKKGWFSGWNTSNAKEAAMKAKELKDKAEKPREESDVEVAREAHEIPSEKFSPLDRLLENVSMDTRPPFRIDYAVQPALTDKSYWSVLKSHFAYWTNTDIALFLVNVLYDSGRVMTAPKDANSQEMRVTVARI
ncbi:unnamed protein product, partial [Mesorhabditis spiculigera]